MAYYRLSLSIRATMLARRSPSFTYISPCNNDGKSSNSSGSKMESLILKQKIFNGSFLSKTFCRTPNVQFGNSVSQRREMSTSTLEAVVASIDSSFPVSAIEYLIQGVHSTTALNWWASIAIATLLVRGVTIPYYLYQVKKEGMKTVAEPIYLTDKNKRFQVFGILFKPTMENVTQTAIFASFFIAILNLAEKVPSFKTGGIFWFIDLSTQDATYIFPVFMVLTFLLRAKLFVMEPLKNCARACAVLSIMGTIYLPNAIFCYWIPSNLVFFCFRYVIAHPRCKKALDISEDDD